MDRPRVVIDTCVLVSALRSRRGASYRVLELVDSGKFQICLSVSLLFEYEAVCKRLINAIPLNEADIEVVLDYVCEVAHHQPIFYLWRPCLSDLNDDLVLELAVAGGCRLIVTHNVRHFRGSQRYGVRAITPQAFLRELGALS